MNSGQSMPSGKALSKRALSPLGFWRGFTYVFSGAKLVYFKHPELVRIWIFPIVLTIVAIGGATWGCWTYSDELIEAMWSHEDGDGFFASFLNGLRSILSLLLFIIMWATSLLVVIGLSNVIAAPFNDSLSEEVERIVTGNGGPKFSFRALVRDLLKTIALELLKLLIFVGIMAPLFCCSLFVPGFGQVVYTVAGFIFTAIYLSVDYIDWPACRRNAEISYRWGVVRSHFGTCMGFGSGVVCVLWIPLLNLFFMPAAVAGGTLLFLDIEAARAQAASKQAQNQG